MNTHDIFDFLNKKVGGHFLCGPHRVEKYAHDVHNLFVSLSVGGQVL